MTEAEPIIWGIHGGRHGEADILFLKKNRIAIGWTKLRDLNIIPPDRETIKARIAEAYPNIKPGALPLEAGMLLRFVHEMKSGDLVVYPSKRDRQVHLGVVEGDYLYDPEKDQNYPHQRPVKWKRTVPRTGFTQGALYEIGSALTLFQVKNYADEFRAAFEGKTPKVVVADDTAQMVAKDIEENTRDFILKQLATELKGHAFAEFVAHLMSTMGYRTRLTPEGPDRGVDIVAHKDELGFEPPIIKVQVKSTEGSVGDPIISALYGKVGEREFGLLVTLGTFTNQAKSFAHSKSNLRLIDGEELVNLILQHYEQFDSRYKGLLPLKRVYVPETLEEETE